MRHFLLSLLALLLVAASPGSFLGAQAGGGSTGGSTGGSSTTVVDGDSGLTLWASASGEIGVIAKGKQPASGLVVNVPSGGGARVGLTSPEVTFASESMLATRNRLVGGIANYSQTSFGNHVANGAPSKQPMPVSLLCTAADTGERLRMDMPQGFDLCLLTLVTRSQRTLSITVQSQAFFLDVAGLLDLRKIGLASVRLQFFHPIALHSYKVELALSATSNTAILKF